MADVVRQVGARLTADVDPVLQKRFYPGDLRNLRRSYFAFHCFDKAHTIALYEAGLIASHTACSILRGLCEMEKEGLQAVRDSMGGGRHSGEAYLTGKIGVETAGWINMGRSSGDLDAMAWRFNIRRRLPELLGRLNDLRTALIRVASEHKETVMPVYSIGQAAQCSSFGHTMLSWEGMFARDSRRAIAARDEVMGSPTGSAIMTGSTFPVSRERTAELLGFDRVHPNTRDAVVNLDSLLHWHSIVAIIISNALSVANDLYLWTMPEFRFVELNDRYCSTSSIMPQKKNSWSLAWIRGQASLAIGRLGGVFTLLKMESDGLEDTLLGPWQLYDALDDAEDMLEMLAGIVSTMKVNTARLMETASHGWTQATDLAALLTQSSGISWRESHQVVANVVREAIAAGISPEDLSMEHINAVSRRLLGKTLPADSEAIKKALDPRASLDARACVQGSPAPEQVEILLAGSRKLLEADRSMEASLDAHEKLFEKKLDAAVEAVLGESEA